MPSTAIVGDVDRISRNWASLSGGIGVMGRPYRGPPAAEMPQIRAVRDDSWRGGAGLPMRSYSHGPMRTELAASIAALVLAIACAAACDRPAETVRDRLLAAVRGDAVIVAVADSRAIAHPRVRGVLDVIAARWPA